MYHFIVDLPRSVPSQGEAKSGTYLRPFDNSSIVLNYCLFLDSMTLCGEQDCCELNLCQYTESIRMQRPGTMYGGSLSPVFASASQTAARV